MSDSDDRRSLADLIRLRDMSRQLGFIEDVKHWQRLIDLRGGSMR